ncbi:putative bifunctional diguanylate cyclase/phosphodiesterase [Roseobacter sp. SK209-2-6]|uniref:putative bifunctional diguanylate cyclase/phosphodiesterase n=1 Tax=Roseobacter sp. SK209-2-6 TaxID=388739 RepID=UPI000310D1F3|nr:bifunctional diguanylate cyclase/phosphodiesterase [Roseobacter sp. SK209-2-6]
MTQANSGFLKRIRTRLAPSLFAPPILAFLPALTLATFWFGGEAALLWVALGVPLIFAALGAFAQNGRNATPRDNVTGLMLREGFELELELVAKDCENSGLRSSLYFIEIDDYKDLTIREGQAASDHVMQTCGERIASTLRNGDTVARIGDSKFAVCLTPVLQLDLESCVQMAGRMQAAVEGPISLDGSTIYTSCSIGFCLNSRAPSSQPSDWSQATNAALSEAQQSGPSGIRVYSSDMHVRTSTRTNLRDEAAEALETGQIVPWFQPQISTDTGKVTGFEALARWMHPVRGMVPPAKFLPVLRDAGLMERLSQVMLYHSLTALNAWDSAGFKIPSVGVNFATQELRNPNLAENIKWELERFNLPAERLSVEILETVMTDQPDDVVTRNIAALSDLGCQIELDDFGTGHASISGVRRFNIARIKIDRSFVMRSDQDPEQQKMIAAILTMAERLDLETLAEGVETAGEHALLSQLGCGHVQGFGIGRPMPFDQTLDWITAHEAKLQDAPEIGRQGS